MVAGLEAIKKKVKCPNCKEDFYSYFSNKKEGYCEKCGTMWGEYHKQQMKQELKIPKNKIKGFRFGQLIYNAISRNAFKSGAIGIEDEDIGSILFNIENKELQELINKYLKEYD